MSLIPCLTRSWKMQKSGVDRQKNEKKVWKNENMRKQQGKRTNHAKKHVKTRAVGLPTHFWHFSWINPHKQEKAERDWEKNTRKTPGRIRLEKNKKHAKTRKTRFWTLFSQFLEFSHFSVCRPGHGAARKGKTKKDYVFIQDSCTKPSNDFYKNHHENDDSLNKSG